MTQHTEVPPLPPPLAVLKEVCLRDGYLFEEVDKFSRFLARVTHGNKSYLAGASTTTCYPLNSAFAQSVARDKAFTYTILEVAGFKTPRTAHVFVTAEYHELRPRGRELASALAAASQIGYPVFVKPNLGTGARDAGPAYDPDELLYLLVKIRDSDFSAIIQEFLSLPEYRIFALDGQIQFAYRKTRPAIMGDGTSTIQQLLTATQMPVHSRFLSEGLLRRQLSLDSVLEMGSRLETSSIGNLGAGGGLNELFETVSGAAQDWTRKLAETTMLRVFSVDFFSKEGLDAPDSFHVLDVNGLPALTTLYKLGHHEVVYRTWSRILDAYFKDH